MMKRTLLISCLSLSLVGSAFAFQEAQVASVQAIQTIPLNGQFSPIVHPQAFSAIYDNSWSYSGFYYNPGGATGTITKAVSDDIVGTDVTGANKAMLRYYVAIRNGNATSVTFRPRMRIHLNSGTNTPGTIVGGVSPTVTMAANSGTVWAINITSPGLSTPSGAKWVSVVFDNVGGTATTADLNNLGVYLYSPPLVGSTTDLMFQTTNPGDVLASNPVGSTFTFGGTPSASMLFAWETQTPVFLHGKVNIPSCSGADLSGKTAHIYARDLATTIGGLPIVDETVTLAADGSFTFTTAWPDPGTTSPSYWWDLPNPFAIKVHVDGWLDEVTENVIVMPDGDCGTVNAGLPGDCNPDNVNDLGDFDVFAAAFGSEVGDGNYNPLCDWDCNGVIDLGDFDLFAAAFGFEGDV